jgi:hypothetical protein
MGMFWARLAVSVADAAFWLLIIGGISLAAWILFKKGASYLLEDIETEEEKEEKD